MKKRGILKIILLAMAVLLVISVFYFRQKIFLAPAENIVYQCGEINESGDYILNQSLTYNSNYGNWCNGADTDKDGAVGWSDYTNMQNNAGRSDCAESNSWCNGTDTDKDGDVDSVDFQKIWNSFGWRCEPGILSSCINITAENVNLDCNGSFVFSDDDIAGIYSNQLNTAIKNCNINVGDGIGGDGIDLIGSNFSIIENVTVSNSYNGIYLESSSHNLLTGITAENNSYTGIQLNQSLNNILSGIIANNNLYYGLGLYASLNNTLQNGNISGNFKNETYLELNSINLSFVNVSYSHSGEHVESGSSLLRKWNLDVSSNVNSAILWQDNLSNSGNGSSPARFELVEYVNNGTDRIYYSPYTVTASKPDYGSVSQPVNMSDNTAIFFTLNCVSNCGGGTPKEGGGGGGGGGGGSSGASMRVRNETNLTQIANGKNISLKQIDNNLSNEESNFENPKIEIPKTHYLSYFPYFVAAGIALLVILFLAIFLLKKKKK